MVSGLQVDTANAARLLDAAKAAKVLVLSKEVVLGIDLRDRRKLNKALVEASFLSSQGFSKKGSPQ